MPASLYALMWVVILAVIVIGAGLLLLRATQPAGPSRRDLERAYQRIDQLESDRDSILDIAYEHKDVDPSLADIVIDEIKKMKQRDKRTKELN